MTNSMSTIVPLLAIVGCICLYVWLIYTQRRKRRQQEQRQQMLKDPSFIYAWMNAENFQPDYFSFYEGSAIGIQDGDPRILLAQASKPEFYALPELRSVKPREFVTSALPLGAAPGVVETREFHHYSLEISFDEKSRRIFFENEEQMNLWASRLEKLITT